MTHAPDEKAAIEVVEPPRQFSVRTAVIGVTLLSVLLGMMSALDATLDEYALSGTVFFLQSWAIGFEKRHNLIHLGVAGAVMIGLSVFMGVALWMHDGHPAPKFLGLGAGTFLGMVFGYFLRVGRSFTSAAP